LGVAILNIVKERNFLSCFGIGKGTYAIDQVGVTHSSAFSWNHHDSTFNSQPKVVKIFSNSRIGNSILEILSILKLILLTVL